MSKVRIEHFVLVLLIPPALGFALGKAEVGLMRMDVASYPNPAELLSDLLFLLIPACLLIPGVLGASCVVRPSRRLLGALLLAALPVIVISWFLAGGLSEARAVRMEAFRSLGQRLTPVVRAIEEYEAAEGRLPSRLDELVPHYLPQLPHTGMGNHPDYEYVVLNGTHAWGANPWVIEMYTGWGFGNFDSFFYCPRQNYEELEWSGWIEVLDGWAYFHE